MRYSQITKKAKHSFLEYAALTPTLAVTIKNPPQMIIAKNMFSFAPNIFKNSLLIAFPPSIKIARDIPYDISLIKN